VSTRYGDAAISDAKINARMYSVYDIQQINAPEQLFTFFADKSMDTIYGL